MKVLVREAIDFNDFGPVMAWNRELFAENNTITTVAKGYGTCFDTKERAKEAIEKYIKIPNFRFAETKIID